jgi:non-ribosomal peptide synthetase component F
MPTRNNCLHHEVFNWQVVHLQAAVAVIDDSRDLTYGELSRAAQSPCSVSPGAGCAPGNPGRPLPRRSADVLVGILDIPKAGGAYVARSGLSPRASPMSWVIPEPGW